MGDENGRDRLERCLRQVEERPGSATAHYNLGLAYTARGMVGRAEEAYRKAIELDPGLVQAWVNLGGTLLLKWDFKGSLVANREALGAMLRAFSHEMADLADTIRRSDSDGLLEIFERAKMARDRYVDGIAEAAASQTDRE